MSATASSPAPFLCCTCRNNRVYQTLPGGGLNACAAVPEALTRSEARGVCAGTRHERMPIHQTALFDRARLSREGL